MTKKIFLRLMSDKEFQIASRFSFENFITESALCSDRAKEKVVEEIGGPPVKTAQEFWHMIESEGTDVGFVWMHLNTIKKSAFIYDIFLEAKFRGCGLGRAVMEMLFSISQAKGATVMQLCVFENNAAARHLYSSLGFQEIAYSENAHQYRLEKMFSPAT